MGLPHNCHGRPNPIWSWYSCDCTAWYHGATSWDFQWRIGTKIELRPWKCGVGEKCWEFHGGHWTNKSIPWRSWCGKRTHGQSGQVKATVLWSCCKGKYQTASNDCTRRKYGRNVIKANDTEDWTGYKYIQLKEMSVDRQQWRKKTRERSAAVANPRRRKAD